MVDKNEVTVDSSLEYSVACWKSNVSVKLTGICSTPKNQNLYVYVPFHYRLLL